MKCLGDRTGTRGACDVMGLEWACEASRDHGVRDRSVGPIV